MKVYAQTIDWMYRNKKAALKRYVSFNKLDPAVAEGALDFYPKAGLRLAPIANFDASMQQAIEYKRLPAPLSKAQMNELIDIVYNPG